MDKLQHKTGSTSTSKEFKRLVKAICRADEAQAHMPDYRFRLMHDVLEITPKPEFLEIYGDSPSFASEVSVRLSADAYDQARKAAPTWDVYALEQEWRMWMNDPPRHPDAAFIGFCRKWYERKGKAP